MSPLKISLSTSILIIFFVQHAFSISSHADTLADVSLKGGPNNSTINHDNRESIYGFSGGPEMRLAKSLGDTFSLGGQIELLYSQRGAKVIQDGQELFLSREHYMDLTIAVRPQVQLGSIHFYLVLGGGLNILMHAANMNQSGADQDITDELHRFDVDLLGAAGIAFTLPHHSWGPFRLDTIFLEARHDIGLLDTNLATTGYQNRSSSAMLGLSFAVSGSSSSSMPTAGPP